MNEKMHVKGPAALQRSLPGRTRPRGASPAQACRAPESIPWLQEEEGQQNSSSALAERQWNYGNWEKGECKHQAINVKGESGKTK